MIALVHPRYIKITVCPDCMEDAIKHYTDLGYVIDVTLYNVSENVYIVRMEYQL